MHFQADCPGLNWSAFPSVSWITQEEITTSGENGFSLIMPVFPLGPHLTLTEYCPLTTQPDIFGDRKEPGLSGLALVTKVVKKLIHISVDSANFLAVNCASCRQ